MAYDNTELDQSGSQSLVDMAKKNASLLDKNIRGSKKANDEADARQKAAAEKYPDSAEAKVEKLKAMFGKKKGGIINKIAYKSGGKVRGCGIAQKGLTKGKMV